jgi:NAD(P)-dependent dehydrogenase (short-subunit alcohol dehydrogenase family)
MSPGETKVAVVTGGGRGIGAASAVALAAAGFDIAIASMEPESDAADVVGRVRELGRNVLYCEHDVAAIERHRALVDRIAGELGTPDCLVNNAGVTSLVRGDMLELAPASFDRAVATNLRGTFFLTQAVARRMIAATPRNGDARYRSIINITSANAEIVGVNRADYCMTKAALSMMSKLYAARLASSRIHVFEIRPGIIRTGMTQPAAAKYDAFIAQDGVPMQRWGTPQDVASAVATLAEGRLPFATGEVINVGGGLHLHRV